MFGKSIRSAFVYFFLKFSKSERTSSRKQKPSQQNIRWYEMRFNEIFLIFVHTQARERWSDETRRKSFVGILFQFNIHHWYYVIHDTLSLWWYHNFLGEIDTQCRTWRRERRILMTWRIRFEFSIAEIELRMFITKRCYSFVVSWLPPDCVEDLVVSIDKEWREKQQTTYYNVVTILACFEHFFLFPLPIMIQSSLISRRWRRQSCFHTCDNWLSNSPPSSEASSCSCIFFGNLDITSADSAPPPLNSESVFDGCF